MPAYNTPKQFPGADRLPPLAQQLLERFFPPDELPTGAAFFPPRLPAPVPQAKDVANAFKPWGKGLEKAYPDMYGASQVPGTPPAYNEMHGALQRLMDLIGQSKGVK